MSGKLKEITYLTIKQLKNKDIVLPSEYSSKFTEVAKDFEIDINDKDVILNDFNNENKKINNIVESTNNSLSSIKDSTEKAKIAIENKDEESLATINKELSEMQEQINFLQKELFSDSLTGAYNRKWFSDYFLSSDKFKTAGKLAFIDLNKFKIINDTYGHLLGDMVLKYLVKFLKKELEVEGVDVVRYAGDEFIILFTGKALNSINIETKMYETQTKLSKQKLKSAKVDSLQFSFSYGLIDFKEDDELEKILETADELMYQNKQKNR